MSSEDFIIHDNERPPEKGTGGRAPRGPKFGCILLALVGAFFIGIVINFFLTGSRQDKIIVSITDAERIPVPDDRGTPEEAAAARAKLETFETAVAANEQAELTLTMDDLNHLVANHATLATVRDMVYFKEIRADGLIIATISLPMNRALPWKAKRYFNGEMDMKIEAQDGRVFLRPVDLRAEGKDLPKEFIEMWQTQDLIFPYKDEHESVEAALQKVNSARSGAGEITLSTAAAEPDPEPVEAPEGEPAEAPESDPLPEPAVP